MSFSLTTHEFEKVPNASGQWKIARVRPYVRLGCKGEVYYIQDGKIWGETGELCEEPPAWVFEQAARIKPAVKAEVGWKDPEPQLSVPPQAASQVALANDAQRAQGNTLSLKGKG